MNESTGTAYQCWTCGMTVPQDQSHECPGKFGPRPGTGWLDGIGTVRPCSDCGVLVAGGPTRCLLCAQKVAPMIPIPYHHSGNIVHVEWRQPVEAPQHVRTILIDYQGVVYAGVFLLPSQPHRDAMVFRYPEDLSPVRLADCDYWADLPGRPYQPEQEAQP